MAVAVYELEADECWGLPLKYNKFCQVSIG